MEGGTWNVEPDDIRVSDITLRFVDETEARVEISGGAVENVGAVVEVEVGVDAETEARMEVVA